MKAVNKVSGTARSQNLDCRQNEYLVCFWVGGAEVM